MSLPAVYHYCKLQNKELLNLFTLRPTKQFLPFFSITTNHVVFALFFLFQMVSCFRYFLSKQKSNVNFFTNNNSKKNSGCLIFQHNMYGQKLEMNFMWAKIIHIITHCDYLSTPESTLINKSQITLQPHNQQYLKLYVQVNAWLKVYVQVNA